MATSSHTAIEAQPRQPLGAESPDYHWWITVPLMLGLTTAGLSVTVVQLAFPHMITSLQAVMMPSVGWLGARLGNRQLY